MAVFWASLSQGERLRVQMPLSRRSVFDDQVLEFVLVFVANEEFVKE
jgi:hypothetical protein